MYSPERMQASGGSKPFKRHLRTFHGIDQYTDRMTRHIGTAAQAQKGIVTYGLSANRQNPFAGAAHAAIFNTWRRASAQILYVVPPFVAAYYIMNWATER
jgi:hypothetical protein